MLVSIDLSLRSTGVVALDNDGTLIDCMLVTPSPLEYNYEELLSYISYEVIEFIYSLDNFTLDNIVIEGLSYNSFSKVKDQINGNFWHLRCRLREEFKNVPIGIIPVTSWRNYFVSKEESRELKNTAGKHALKQACIGKVPEKILNFFIQYMIDTGRATEELYNLIDTVNESRYASLRKCSEGIYDLTDAFLLGCYRLTLE